MKRMLSLLLCLSLLAVCLPASVSAALPAVLTVGTQSVTEGGYWLCTAAGGLTSVGADAAHYQVAYDPALGVLTLQNALLTQAGTPTPDLPSRYGIYARGDLTLRLIGDSTVDLTDATASGIYGIHVMGRLTLTGDTLTVRGGTNDGTSAAHDTGYSYGLFSTGGIVVSAGVTLTAAAGDNKVNPQYIRAISDGVTLFPGAAATASLQRDGSDPAAFDPAAAASYQYVHIEPGLTVTKEPQDVFTYADSLTDTLSVTVDSHGRTPVYQWYSTPDPSGELYLPVAGATGAVMTLPASLRPQSQPYYYFCRISADGALPLDSRAAAVTVGATRPAVTAFGPVILGKGGEANTAVVLTFSTGLTLSAAAAQNAPDWFTDVPEGLTLSGALTGTSPCTVTVTVTGTPTADCCRPLAVTVPAGTLTISGKTYGEPLSLTGDAVWDVSGYALAAAPAVGGTVTVPVRAQAGSTVTVTASPLRFYRFDALTVTAESGVPVAADGTAFTMPDSAATVQAAFVPDPEPLPAAKLAYTTVVYTGKAQKPAVTVAGLVQGVDYTVAYKNNVNAGTATVTVTGKGNYKGTVKKTFTVTQKPLAGAAVTGLAAKVFTGKAQKPAPTVKLGGKTLKAGTDYAVTYKNNTLPGTATVTVTGKGNYKGTVKKTFTISPKAPTVTLTAGSGKVTAKWAKVTGATGCEVQLATNKAISKGVKKASVTGVSKTFTGLRKGTAYYVRVRAYKTVSGKKIYSAWSAVKYTKAK